MKSITAPAVVLAVLCVAATPAAAQNREHQQMAAELRMLQEQNQQLSLALQQTLNQLAEAVKAINARLDATEVATRKTLADQKLIVDGLATELRVIRERTQDTNTRLGTISEEIQSLRSVYTAAPAQSSTDRLRIRPRRQRTRSHRRSPRRARASRPRGSSIRHTPTTRAESTASRSLASSSS